MDKTSRWMIMRVVHDVFDKPSVVSFESTQSDAWREAIRMSKIHTDVLGVFEKTITGLELRGLALFGVFYRAYSLDGEN